MQARRPRGSAGRDRGGKHQITQNLPFEPLRLLSGVGGPPCSHCCDTMFNRTPQERINTDRSVSTFTIMCVHQVNDHTAKADNELLIQALETYHQEKEMNNDVISQRLERDRGITMRFVHFMSQHSVCDLLPTQRGICQTPSKKIGLQGSRTQTKSMEVTEARQLVITRWMPTAHAGQV